MRQGKVVVVGSSNMDMVVKSPHIPAPGETILGNQFKMIPGGKGANQAVAAARLGAHVTLVARLGTDLFGDRSMENFASEGIDASYIVRDLEVPSGVALICVSDHGENSIVVAPGANGRLSVADIEAAHIAVMACDVVVIQLEIPLETVAHTISKAKALGKTIILNPAPACSLPEGFLKDISILTPNEIEASMLLGIDPKSQVGPSDLANRLLVLGPGAVIITLGGAGVLGMTHDEEFEIAPMDVQVVDSTAAGDCFTGALATGIAEGMGLHQACAFANIAAALSVTKEGAQPSLPVRESVNTLLSAT